MFAAAISGGGGVMTVCTTVLPARMPPSVMAPKWATAPVNVDLIISTEYVVGPAVSNVTTSTETS